MIDPELQAEMSRRGLIPAAPKVDPELMAEMQRRGLTPTAPAQADPPMFRGPASPYGAEAAAKAVGRGGKRLNELIQNAIGSGVEAAGKRFGPVVGNTAAFAAAPTAGLIDAMIPKDKWGAAAMALPTGGVDPAPLTAPLGKAARGLGSLAEGTVEHASQLVSKRTPQAFEMLRQDPEGVLGAARKGMGLNELTHAPEPVALAEAQSAGRNAQGIVEDSAKGAGREFGAMMDHLHGDVSGDKFDVAGKVYDTMEPYLAQQGATLRRPVGDSAERGSKGVMDIYERIKNTMREGMAPGDAADALQELTAIQRHTPEVSAHARALKEALTEALPGDYKFPTGDTPTPSGWGIKETRDSYAAAKNLQRDLKPFTNPQNPLQALRSVARAGGDASQSLKAATEKIPALKAALDKMNVSSAGAEFAPKITTPPGTGLTGAAGLLLTKLLGGNVAALPSTALFGLGMSPRLTAETLVAGRKAGGILMNAGRAIEPHTPAITAALLRLAGRKNKDEAP